MATFVELSAKFDGVRKFLTPNILSSPYFCWIRLDEQGKEFKLCLSATLAELQQRDSKAYSDIQALFSELKYPNIEDRIEPYFLQPKLLSDEESIALSAGRTNTQLSIPIQSTAKARAGSRIYTQYDGRGTLGWIVRLNGRLVGISCYHVLCQDGDQTEPLTPVMLDCNNCDNGRDLEIGQLLRFRNMQSGGRNIFDFAMFAFRSPDHVAAEFVPSTCDHCSASVTKAYPTDLGDASLIGEGQMYYCIGAISHTCYQTRFRGIGLVSMHESPRYILDRQLFFDYCGEPGDSGALVVHAVTNKAVGIFCMTGDWPSHSVASPLFEIGWVRDQESDHGDGFPSFRCP